jgi:hypothetical protein
METNAHRESTGSESDESLPESPRGSLDGENLLKEGDNNENNTLDQ